MQLIDGTFFIGELTIPHLDTVGVSERLDVFIKKYEKIFLTLLLGESTYNDFMAGLEENPIPAKWQTLKDLLVDSTDKESPIANFVYFHWMVDKITQTVGLGESKAKAENSTIVNNDPKRVRAWNEMVIWVRSKKPFFETNKVDYYSATGYYYMYFNCGCWNHLYRPYTWYHVCGCCNDPFEIQNTLNL